MASTVGSRIEYAREQARLSQNELARLVGISQPSLFEIESGKGSTKHLVTIALILNVRPEWLALGKGPIRPGPTPTMRKTVTKILVEHCNRKVMTPERAGEIANLILQALHAPPS